MKPRVRVKICGITNQADAEAAMAAGADALGFNLFPGSKRFISWANLRSWIRDLPPTASQFAVLVNADQKVVRAAAELCAVLQFHGGESAAECAVLAGERSWVKGLPLRSVEDFARAREFVAAGASAVLVDAYVPGAFGGTGELVDFGLAAELASEPDLRVILAGGLRPENVGEAVAKVRPYAVDVASGVEMAGDPRRKDAKRMREFIIAVREAAAS